MSTNDNVIKIETQEQRLPDNTILGILQAHAGQSIIIRVYRKGRVARRSHLKSGRDAGTAYHFHQEAYDVPPLRNSTEPHADINHCYKGRNFEGWRYQWKYGSDAPHSSYLEIGDEVRVFPATTVVPRRRAQRFASGVSHCSSARSSRAW